MELTPRLKKLQDRLFNVEYHDPGVWHFQNTNILTDDGIRREPLVVRKAKAIEHICLHLPAIVKPDELIVGNPNQNSVAWGTVLPIYYTEEEGGGGQALPAQRVLRVGPPPARVGPDHQRGGHRGQAGDHRRPSTASSARWRPTPQRWTSTGPCSSAWTAWFEFARRHAEAALKMALAEADPIRRRELFEIHQVCSHVPLHPARSLHEATQAYWFTYCIVNSGGEFVPLARGDQFLYPFFRRDLEEHRITKERAVDLIGSFLVKCNERIIVDTKKAENHYSFGLFSQGLVPDEAKPKSQTGGYEQRGLSWREEEDVNSEANFNYGQSGNDWLMNFIVGGQHPDGSDATNELSYLFIDLMHDLKLLMPTLAARVHKNMPESFWRKIAEALRYGQGEPMVYNDETIIPGFVDLGIPVEEARGYSNDGCWETLIPGKSHFSYAHVESLQCLEWVLHRGKSATERRPGGPGLRRPAGPRLLGAVLRGLQAAGRRPHRLPLPPAAGEPGPVLHDRPRPADVRAHPGLRAQGPGPVAGRGALHLPPDPGHGPVEPGGFPGRDQEAGVRGAAASSSAELIRAVREDWKGHERLRALVLNEVPKFGNDDAVRGRDRRAGAEGLRGPGPAVEPQAGQDPLPGRDRDLRELRGARPRPRRLPGRPPRQRAAGPQLHARPPGRTSTGPRPSSRASPGRSCCATTAAAPWTSPSTPTSSRAKPGWTGWSPCSSPSATWAGRS